jgi:hypothetical protein
MNRGCGAFHVIDSAFSDHRRPEKSGDVAYLGFNSKRWAQGCDLYIGCLGKAERILR